MSDSPYLAGSFAHTVGITCFSLKALLAIFYLISSSII